VVVIFAGAMLLFVLLAATVIDMSWYWTNNLRIQRAADAAALAGVIFLPGQVPEAVAVALDEAAKNGFENGIDGAVVTAFPDEDNDRRLIVTISADVHTYFARVVGISSWRANRTATADYIVKVPMGSPEHYFGVFGKLRTPGGGVNVPNPPQSAATSWFSPDDHSPDSGNWTDPDNAYEPELSGSVDAATNDGSSSSDLQAWGEFGVMLPSPPASPGTEQSFTVNGIELGVRAESSDATGCQLRASLTWDDAGVTDPEWTASRTIGLDGAYSYQSVGGGSDTWGRSWSRGELDDSDFRARVERFDPDPGNNSTCDDDFTASIDHIRVRVYWTQVTTTFVPDVNLAGPGGEALTPRGFWGTMLTQGADDINGDAYLPNFEGGSTANPDYQPDKFYDYGVDMRASSGGSVYIFDPVFCATSSSGQFGTGDRWFGSATATSSWFELWDTQNTAFTTEDDVRVDPTGDDDLFANIRASDTTLNGPSSGGTASCAQGATTNQGDGRYWHNRWWRLATGLPGGTVYRIRTRTTDPDNASAQTNADGENSFAIYTTAATGPLPKVFGVGAMESFSPLSGDETSEFYLAQIDDVHAGKTVVISLWDPGDTGSLTGQISIRVPSAAGYTSANLTWESAKGTTHGSASNCNGLSGSGSTIATHSSGQRFNGCWLTIKIPIPVGYSTADAPPGEPEAGWWKIRYTMAGSSSDTSLDVTTWQVDIVGNPVHLVLP
jgi:hypothetical protein